MSEASHLPEILPVFPLTGTLLLPGNWLPLHIFEARYRNMVEDALSRDGVIGMIQPFVPAQDNAPPREVVLEEVEPPRPDLYEVGCAGRIDECQRSADGRYALTLVGVSRFRVRRELDLVRGYRTVVADYDEFATDLGEPLESPASEDLLEALVGFGKTRDLSFELSRLRELSDEALVNGLAMALPFEAAEKQALLEASVERRRTILFALLAMGSQGGSAAEEGDSALN